MKTLKLDPIESGVLLVTLSGCWAPLGRLALSILRASTELTQSGVLDVQGWPARSALDPFQALRLPVLVKATEVAMYPIPFKEATGQFMNHREVVALPDGITSQRIENLWQGWIPGWGSVRYIEDSPLLLPPWAGERARPLVRSAWFSALVMAWEVGIDPPRLPYEI